MVGKAQDKEHKWHIECEEVDEVTARAVNLYLSTQQAQGDEKKMGYQKVCEKVEEDYWKETRQMVKLNHNTLANHIKGGKSLSEFNAEKSWLTKEEEEAEVVIHYTLEHTAHGFPLSHHCLKEHIGAILHGRLGNKFPTTGIGHNWTHHFIAAHSDKLRMGWACQLDSKHGYAVNATNDRAWFKVFGDTIKDVDEECIWLQTRVGFRQVVLFVNRSLAKWGNLFNISNKMAIVKISLSL